MATDVRFLHQETSQANISNVLNTQSFILNENDSDMGFRTIGFVDGAGTPQRIVCKNQDAFLSDIYINSDIICQSDTGTFIRETPGSIYVQAADINTYINVDTADGILMSDEIAIEEYLRHKDDETTHLRFEPDKVSLVANTNNTMELDDSFTVDVQTNISLTAVDNYSLSVGSTIDFTSASDDITLTADSDIVLSADNDIKLERNGTQYGSFDESGYKPINNATTHIWSNNLPPTSTADGALWLDERSLNGDLMCYFKGEWKKVATLTPITDYSSASESSSVSSSSSSTDSSSLSSSASSSDSSSSN